MATKSSQKKVTPKKTSKAIATPMSDKAQQAKWQAEDDVRTLQRAGEIERDRARLAKAQAMAKKQADDLARITKVKK